MADLKVPVTSADHIRGPQDAPVTLVEYGDYECPYCAASHFVVMAVQDRFGDQVRFVFRNFPLTEIHPLAEPAAESAEAAGAHGHFWEMHDGIYENRDRLGVPLLVALGEAVGVTHEELADALQNHRFVDKIQRDFAGGVNSGVTGTPAFFINGQRHTGKYDLPHLAAAIEARLGTAEARP